MRAVKRLALAALLALSGGAATAQQISTLPAASAFNASDLFPATQNFTSPGTGTTRKVTGAMVQAFISAQMPSIMASSYGTVRGSILRYGATAWESVPPGTAGYVWTSAGSGADPTWQAIALALNDLTDVNTAGAVNGNALVYNGSAWVPGAAGSGTMTSLTCGTGLSGGTITTSGTCAVSYGTSASTALEGSTRGAASGVASLDASTLVPVAQLPPAAVRRGFSQPFQGAPTTGDPDVYQIPDGGSADVAASTVPAAICRVNPAGTVTFLVKKWTGTSSASSSTLCTGSLSTSCVVSGCSISATSFASNNGVSIEATAASADTAARFTITVPWDWK